MKILICGYIGGGNCGDEAICDRLIASIRKRGDAVTLLSLSPAESESLHRVPARHRRAAPKAIGECDLLILGGGTLLQTQTSVRSAVYYLSLATTAAIMGKPWVLLGGIDPLNGVATRIAKAILPTARAFFLRDGDSLCRAKALAPSVPRFYLPDCALLPLGKSVFKGEKPRHPYAVICPKAGVRGKTVAPIVRSIKKRGLRLVFMAMSREDEAICAVLAKRFGGVFVSVMTPHIPAARRVRAETILPNLPPHSPHRYYAALPCEIACRLIAGAEEVYSARLHGLIFARKAGVQAHILPDGTVQWKLRGFLRGTF
ncbi:MAG: polysaccharide pyruvyl transferase family protein [Clostridia bacterium]|nr:polysaccharide pyruvyl transferase family protein [Clostridia bacterium]